jgi:hypothetical protein
MLVHFVPAGVDQVTFGRAQENVFDKFIVWVRGFEAGIVAFHTCLLKMVSVYFPKLGKRVVLASTYGLKS